ncbi:MAG: N-acetylmuramoyl-L-alanine amidase [Sphingomonadaceae bacterium]
MSDELAERAARWSLAPPALFDQARARAQRGAGVSMKIPVRRLAGGDMELPQVHGDPGRPLVVIDPGHGGRDPGAISPHGGQREKDVTLAVSLAIRDAIVAGGRARVALTREDDSYVLLRDRFAIARRLEADLFISVHADSAPNPNARGASIYTLSEVASTREAALLAARENRADFISGIDIGDEDRQVSSILIDLAQRDAMAQSSDFADILYREASDRVPFRDNHRHFASFIVLKAPDIPSILFETGYLTQPRDLAYIHSPEGREAIAEGFAEAVRAYFARRNFAARGAEGSGRS